MSAVRSVLFWALFGGLAGTWVGGFISRSFLPWFNTPGSGIRSQCDCEPLAISTVSHTLSIEFWGLVIGAIVCAVLAIVFGAGRKRKVEPPAPATPPAATA
jgi:ABC-type phosphate/phosphonate transport system permease subunit